MKTSVGYTGGDDTKAENPSYRQVCSGETGHAEALRIEFDPSVVSYGELVGEWKVDCFKCCCWLIVGVDVDSFLV